jgi:hypothetical protein
MGSFNGTSNCESAELSMVIIRADGRKEDLGVVSYYHKNPLKRMLFNIKQFLKHLFKGN